MALCKLDHTCHAFLLLCGLKISSIIFGPQWHDKKKKNSNEILFHGNNVEMILSVRSFKLVFYQMVATYWNIFSFCFKNCELHICKMHTFLSTPVMNTVKPQLPLLGSEALFRYMPVMIDADKSLYMWWMGRPVRPWHYAADSYLKT